MTNNNFTIYQVPNSYSFIVAFYGRCNPSEPCVNFDMRSSNFKSVVDSAFQIDVNKQIPHLHGINQTLRTRV